MHAWHAVYAVCLAPRLSPFDSGCMGLRWVNVHQRCAEAWAPVAAEPKISVVTALLPPRGTRRVWRRGLLLRLLALRGVPGDAARADGEPGTRGARLRVEASGGCFRWISQRRVEMQKCLILSWNDAAQAGPGGFGGAAAGGVAAPASCRGRGRGRLPGGRAESFGRCRVMQSERPSAGQACLHVGRQFLVQEDPGAAGDGCSLAFRQGFGVTLYKESGVGIAGSPSSSAPESGGQPVAIIRSLAESVDNVEKVLVLAQDIHSSGVELRYLACIYISVSGLRGRSCACAATLKATEDVKFTSPTSTESRSFPRWLEFDKDCLWH